MKKIKLLTLLLSLIPVSVSAQQNVAKAFEQLLKNSTVTYTEKHGLEKDVTTGKKSAQYDVYNFSLPASKMQLISNIVDAFRKDEPTAYSSYSGKSAAGDDPLLLAVGNGNSSVEVTYDDRNCDYIYACYLAPAAENQDNNYRYAYALSWTESDGKITGKLAVTYATTLQYRMKSQGILSPIFSYNGQITIPMSGSITKDEDEPDSWFAEFMTYVNAMERGNDKLLSSLATRLYEFTKKIGTYKDVTKSDKNTAIEILKNMTTNKRYNQGTVLQLLNASLQNIQ